MRTVRVVATYDDARTAGATRDRLGWWRSGGTRFLTPLSIRQGAVRGLTLDRVEDPGGLLDEVGLAEVAPCILLGGELVRGDADV